MQVQINAKFTTITCSHVIDDAEKYLRRISRRTTGKYGKSRTISKTDRFSRFSRSFEIMDRDIL